MTSIPIGEAAFAGFGVIRRRPLAVLAWGLVLFALTILPLFAMFGILAPGVEELIAAGMREEEPTFEGIIGLQAQMMAIHPIMMLGSLTARVVLTCAVFRAVLAPQDSRWAYLRLGKTELLVGLVLLCVVILLGFLVLFAFAIGAALTAAVWMGSEAAGITVAVVAGVALVGVIVWLGLRLSMALPMTFADGEFRLFESWALTRGRVLSLLLLAVLVMVAVMLVELVVMAVGGAIALAWFAANPVDEASMTAFFSRPYSQWAAELAPWALAGGLVISMVGALFLTVATAPWAAAYRALAPKPAPAAENPA